MITDVVMPEMNGWELAERLRSVRPKLKFLFMSGYTAKTIAGHGLLEDGVHFFYRNPFPCGSWPSKCAKRWAEVLAYAFDVSMALKSSSLLTASVMVVLPMPADSTKFTLPPLDFLSLPVSLISSSV